MDVFLILVILVVFVALSVYVLGVVPAYNALVDRYLVVKAPPTPPSTAPTAHPSTTTAYVAPDTSCGAPIDCNAASHLALDYYMTSGGGQPGTTITKVAGSADPLACSYAFGKPTANGGVLSPADERRFVFAKDAKTCAPTRVDSMGGAGSGFLVENVVPGTLSLGGMCAMPHGGLTANGVAVEFQPCDANSPAQLWTFDPSMGQLQPQADRSYCLDVAGVSRDNGAKVQLWSCNEMPGQVWSYDESKGEVRSGVRPGFCLEAPGANSSAGARLGMWDCNGVANAQRFATTVFR